MTNNVVSNCAATNNRISLIVFYWGVVNPDKTFSFSLVGKECPF